MQIPGRHVLRIRLPTVNSERKVSAAVSVPWDPVVSQKRLQEVSADVMPTGLQEETSFASLPAEPLPILTTEERSAILFTPFLQMEITR